MTTVTHTVVRVTTKLSGGYEVASIKGRIGVEYAESNGDRNGEYIDQTTIYHGGLFGHDTEIVGTFDAHEAVVASLEFSTGEKRLERNQHTNVYYGVTENEWAKYYASNDECDTVSQEGK